MTTMKKNINILLIKCMKNVHLFDKYNPRISFVK